MVPPESILGVVPIWVGVYVALAAAMGASGLLFYRRVIRLVLLGRKAARFDRPLRRFVNFPDGVSGTAEGAAKGVTEGHGGDRARSYFLRISVVPAQLRDIHIRGLGMGAFFADDSDGGWGTGLRDVPGHRGDGYIVTMLGWAVVSRWLMKPHQIEF